MSIKQRSKNIIKELYQKLDLATENMVEDVLLERMHPDVFWRGYHPFNEQIGPKAVSDEFWRPLKRALSNLQRRMDIFICTARNIDFPCRSRTKRRTNPGHRHRRRKGRFASTLERMS